MKTTSPSAVRLVVLSLSFLGAALITGCGIGSVDHSVTSQASAIQGQVHGGESPIIYSKITFYETATSGVATTSGVSTAGVSTAGVYVGAATALGSTYTDYNGNFSFATPRACNNSADFVYAVAAGGNAGSFPGTLNPNLLLMAAVGSCANFGAQTFVVINELSTVAAAYALQGFTSITGAFTSAASGSTSATVTSITSQGAVFDLGISNLSSGQPITIGEVNGIPYDKTFFINSVSGTTVTLSDPDLTPGDVIENVAVTTVTSVPTVNVTASSTNYATSNAAGTSAAGLAHAFTTANLLVEPYNNYASTISPYNSSTVLPTSMVNLLGNILQSCVNSVGGSAGSATNCGTLFTNTTAPGATQAPTTTLAAALNIAHFPTQNVSALFGLASGSAAFNPYIGSSANLNDLSLAIAYQKQGGVTTFYPLSVTVDGNDDVYVLNSNSAATASQVVAFSNDTAPKWTTALDSTTYVAPKNIAADGLGKVWFINDASAGHVVGFNTSSGTPVTSNVAPSTTFPTSLAFDTSNDMYLGFSNTAANIKEEKLGTSYSLATWGCCGTSGSAGAGYTYQVALDSSNNIWLSQYNSSGAAPAVMAYNAGYPTTEIAATTATITAGYGITVDSAGNGWADSATSLFKLTRTPATGVITSIAGSNPTGSANIGTALRYLITDGNNNILTVDTTAYKLVRYNSTATTPTAYLLAPCITNAATTCPTIGTTYPVGVDGIASPRNLTVDSSGNVWVASPYSNELIEVIGFAAPTWPLTAVQKPGIMP